MSTDNSVPTLPAQPEQRVSEWMKEQLNNEVNRLKSLGTLCLPMPVNNTAISVDNKVYYNRVEFNTAFDFNRVKMVIVSNPIPCPHKPGYNYINVVLFCEKTKPMILPYLYDSSYASKGHSLKNWLFINNKDEYSYHVIDDFEEIQQ